MHFIQREFKALDGIKTPTDVKRGDTQSGEICMCCGEEVDAVDRNGFMWWMRKVVFSGALNFL